MQHSPRRCHCGGGREARKDRGGKPVGILTKWRGNVRGRAAKRRCPVRRTIREWAPSTLAWLAAAAGGGATQAAPSSTIFVTSRCAVNDRGGRRTAASTGTACRTIRRRALRRSASASARPAGPARFAFLFARRLLPPRRVRGPKSQNIRPAPRNIPAPVNPPAIAQHGNEKCIAVRLCRRCRSAPAPDARARSASRPATARRARK